MESLSFTLYHVYFGFRPMKSFPELHTMFREWQFARILVPSNYVAKVKKSPYFFYLYNCWQLVAWKLRRRKKIGGMEIYLLVFVDLIASGIFFSRLISMIEVLAVFW